MKAIVLMSSVGRFRRKSQVLSGRLGSYLIVDPIVVAAAFLHGHTGCEALKEVRITFAALTACFQALNRCGDGRAAQGAGVCQDRVVAVRGALHRCEKGVLVRTPGQRLGFYPFCFPSVPFP